MFDSKHDFNILMKKLKGLKHYKSKFKYGKKKKKLRKTKGYSSRPIEKQGWPITTIDEVCDW